MNRSEDIYVILDLGTLNLFVSNNDRPANEYKRDKTVIIYSKNIIHIIITTNII